MKVCLVRHGETAWTLSGQHTGTTDLGLTVHGEDQARGLTKRLHRLGFAKVLVSPRLRAHQTCDLANLDTVAMTDPDLSEWHYGRYEGLRSEEIRREDPDWNIWRDGCPGGESPVEVSARADRVIARINEIKGSVALFSHGQFGAALAVRWIGLALIEGQHFALQTASVSRLGVDPHHPEHRTIESWNEA